MIGPSASVCEMSPRLWKSEASAAPLLRCVSIHSYPPTCGLLARRQALRLRYLFYPPSLLTSPSPTPPRRIHNTTPAFPLAPCMIRPAGREPGGPPQPATATHLTLPPQAIYVRHTAYVNAEARRTQDFRVHHDLPSVHRQVRIVERPVKHLCRNRLVRGVMVRSEVFMRQCFRRRDTGPGVEYEHLFKQVERYTLVCPS